MHMGSRGSKYRFSTRPPRPLLLLYNFLLLLLGVGLAGCRAQIVAITFPGDPNPGEHAVCTTDPEAEPPSFVCTSLHALFSADREVDLSKATSGTQCKNHVVKLWLETNNAGEVVRIQFQCALDDVGGFPQ